MRFLGGMFLFCLSDCLLASASLQTELPRHGNSAFPLQHVAQYKSGLIERGQKIFFERLQVVAVIEETTCTFNRCSFSLPTPLVKTEGAGITNTMHAPWEYAYICRSFM